MSYSSIQQMVRHPSKHRFRPRRTVLAREGRYLEFRSNRAELALLCMFRVFAFEQAEEREVF